MGDADNAHVLVVRRFPVRLSIAFGAPVALRAAAWAGAVYALYAYAGFTLLKVPFLPIATMGTAVAFYVGFKNNAAYERFWEARKIWGGIVNASRTWSATVQSYVDPNETSDAACARRRDLVYRHLAWVNALRLQLRATSRFHDKPARTTRKRLERHADHMRNDWNAELSAFLTPEELAASRSAANAATQLLVRQSTRLAELKAAGHVDLFHQIAMMEVVQELYGLQGKCERIKNTPFPRQYAEYSRIFTRVFIALVPCGLLNVFADNVERATALAAISAIVPMIVSSSLVTWVFITMEGIGDSSEDPFERSMNDVPMNALSRTIEIDLRQTLGETDLPPKEMPADGILY